jgi:D-glycero-D-manno-heptose 1,7-bisphosphate phosphatase
VVLDRDGTLIDFVRDPELGAVVAAFHPDQIRFLPGVLDGLRLLAERGLVLAIATNQPGAAKGQVPLEAIHRTNDALLAMLRAEGIAIAALAVCLHHPEGGPGGDPALVGPCDCRKPAPGLVRGLLRDLALDPAGTFMVGDAMSDVEAGAAAGTRTALLLDTGRCEMCPQKPAPLAAPAPLTTPAPLAPVLLAVAPASLGARSPVRPDLVAPRFDVLARAIADALS